MIKLYRDEASGRKSNGDDISGSDEIKKIPRRPIPRIECIGIDDRSLRDRRGSEVSHRSSFNDTSISIVPMINEIDDRRRFLTGRDSQSIFRPETRD